MRCGTRLFVMGGELEKRRGPRLAQPASSHPDQLLPPVQMRE